ncbi:LacI family DNA-binding transcriptional regulator [Fusibacter tunisiensis]|uniref:DNA-binding LacI/PurR family transcriptional regulator n=1 Tax=Fusibacter tunisiensis TaxID=1008308 RepID=A0ABS2MN17_9FIRM|nr:LacI family DNA-binding transcriptional regulator [Fusibacter tunisiensis]MBM7560786.1 DNA-binding LacI/PurR family transcriptional regulator [Fusibacter tunisiensis]
MAVTIKDVARLANVSPSTVSRVISNSSRISDATKNVVYAAMEELNYKPNAIARNLANASTKTLGLIIPNKEENLFKNPFFIQAMRGISIYSQKKNYKIMFNYSSNPEDELSFVREFVHSKWVDGIILLTANEDDLCIDYLNEQAFPFVVIGRPFNLHDIMWVDNDNFQATYHLVNKLIQKGCQDIAFIGGPSRRIFSKDRLEGYKRAIDLRNLTLDEALIVETNDFTDENGYQAMKEICKHKIPDAVVTTDDLLAFGVLKYIREHDYKIKVTGFNNTPLSEYQMPALTSVDIKAEDLGYNAAKLLIRHLEGRDSPVNHFIVGTELIERQSTK